MVFCLQMPHHWSGVEYPFMKCMQTSNGGWMRAFFLFLLSIQAGQFAIAATTATIITVQPTLNNPTTSGTALLNAVSTYKSSATAANPYLIKISPGKYDIGSNALQMYPYLDIEGSGQGVTIIIGRYTQTILLTANADLRNLTVQNTYSGGSVLMCPASTLVTGVTVCSSTSMPRISDVTVQTTQSNQYGLYIAAGAPIVSNSTIQVIYSGFSSPLGTVNAVYVNQNGAYSQPAFFRNVVVTLVGPSLDTSSLVYGFRVGNKSSVVMYQTTIGNYLTNSVYVSLGTSLANSTVNVQNSELHSPIFVGAYNVFRAAATMVDAAVTNSSGSVACVASYNFNFMLVGAGCS